jgi:hypothetical protein
MPDRTELVQRLFLAAFWTAGEERRRLLADSRLDAFSPA